MKRIPVLLVAATIAAIAFSSAAFGQKALSISEVQGDRNTSPHEREIVTVTGVVTARTKTGFFIQTPDDKTDGNPATSEGIFVFTKNPPPVEIAIGSLVSVAGEVQEYRNRNDVGSLTTTELSHRLGQDRYSILSKANALPKPIVLTAADFSSNAVDELERFEGMRVLVPEMNVVAPTGGRVDIRNASAESNGVFFGVAKGVARPFREPGLDVRDLNASPDKDKWKRDLPKMQVFDSNPEVLRVDTNEQLVEGSNSTIQQTAPSLNATAGMILSDVTGVMHFAFGRYTLLLDPSKISWRTAAASQIRCPFQRTGNFQLRE